MALGQVPVSPSEVLLVTFDLTHGDDHKICIVGKKDGEIVTIVNAFEGDKAEEIFRLLTTVASNVKTVKEEQLRF